LNPVLKAKSQRKAVTRAPIINLALKGEVVIGLHLLLFSAHYTVLQTNNSVRNFSAMNPCKPVGSHFTNQHLALSAKRTGTREDKGSTMMPCMWLLQLVKSTSLDEATSSSEEIKPVALSIVELCLAESIS